MEMQEYNKWFTLVPKKELTKFILRQYKDYFNAGIPYGTTQLIEHFGEVFQVFYPEYNGPILKLQSRAYDDFFILSCDSYMEDPYDFSIDRITYRNQKEILDWIGVVISAIKENNLDYKEYISELKQEYIKEFGKDDVKKLFKAIDKTFLEQENEDELSF